MQNVMAIDPGNEKCGVAIVADGGEVLHRAVVAKQEILDAVSKLLPKYAPVALVLGKGTGSKPLVQRFKAANLGVPIELRDESHTSEEARRRFVVENPPKGWNRLLPRSLRTPDVPYDDYVAIILGERFWKEKL